MGLTPVEPALALAVMEPGDLQPLTVYNEHARGAHGHKNPRGFLGWRRR